MHNPSLPKPPFRVIKSTTSSPHDPDPTTKTASPNQLLPPSPQSLISIRLHLIQLQDNLRQYPLTKFLYSRSFAFASAGGLSMNRSHCGTNSDWNLEAIISSASPGADGFLGGGGAGDDTRREGEGLREEDPRPLVGGARWPVESRGEERSESRPSRRFFLPPRWPLGFRVSRLSTRVPSTSTRGPDRSSKPFAIISEVALEELLSFPSSPRYGSADMTQRISEFCFRFSSLQARWSSRRDLPL